MELSTEHHGPVKFDTSAASPLISVEAENTASVTLTNINGKLRVSSDIEFTTEDASIDPVVTPCSSLIPHTKTTWTKHTITSISERNWQKPRYGNGVWVVVAKGMKFAYSTNLINWQETVVNGATNNTTWNGLAFGAGKFIAIANGSYDIATSTDGHNWTITRMQTKDENDNIVNFTMPSGGASWSDICYTGSRFVASANSQYCAYSPDGGGLWYSMTYQSWGRGVSVYHVFDRTYIMQAYTYHCAYLLDKNPDETICYTWKTSNISGNSGQSFYAIAYGAGVYILTKHKPVVHKSTNGSSWSSTGDIISDSHNWGPITYGADKFIMIDEKASIFTIAYSSDGSTWTELTVNQAGSWNSIWYENGSFVVTSTKKNLILYSSDGLTWKNASIANTDVVSRNWMSCCYGNNYFVMVAKGTNFFALSSDGYDWMEQVLDANSTSGRDWSSVCYGNGQFIAVCRSREFAYKKNNDAAWTVGLITEDQKVDPDDSSSHNTCYSIVCYGNGTFVAFQSDTEAQTRLVTDKMAYSTDGMTWNISELPVPGIWSTVCYGNGKFVCVGYNKNEYISGSPEYDMVIYSTDGITWSVPSGLNGLEARSWYSVCYGDGKYVAIANGGTTASAAYSVDCITWTMVTLPKAGDNYYRSVCYGNGQFTAAANRTQTVIYSRDATKWISNSIGTSSEKQRNLVYYANGLFIMPITGATTVYTLDTRDDTTKEIMSLTVKQAYPIGALYLTDGTNPLLILGFGEWNVFTVVSNDESGEPVDLYIWRRLA